MIDDLRATKTANFYLLKSRLSGKVVQDLFRQLRGERPSVSRNLFCHCRENHNGAVWSAISFQYDQRPSFLEPLSNVRERVCGYLLIVEHNGHLAVFKSRLNLPASFVAKYLGRVNAEVVDSSVAQADAIFEKIRLRNMSISKMAMRSKTLESADLNNVVGVAGAGRYVPLGYSVRLGNEVFSATPGTGRITQRSDRIEYGFLIDYARTVIDDLAGQRANASNFLQTFARSINLDSIRGKTQPTIFAVDVAHLTTDLFEDQKIRFAQLEGDEYTELSKADAEAVIQELDEVFALRFQGKKLEVISRDGAASVGEIAFNKTRIALRSLDLPLSAAVEVERCDFAIGHDPDRQSLRSYIDKANAFIVLFDQLSLAYIDGTLFRDETFTNGATTFLKYFRTEASLTNVTDEKGTFTDTHTEFDQNSTFGVVVQSVAVDDEVLVCDDLGDEWADFIGLDTKSNPTKVSFYHAKHGPLSLGAGPFHISVSQALKNLGRMRLETDAIARKLPGWQTTYNNDGASTAIPRTLKGNATMLEQSFERARSSPDAIRRVFIVTSSLSKAAVEQALNGVADGRVPDPYFVQFYWLMLSFFSACAEVGAYGYVICQE